MSATWKVGLVPLKRLIAHSKFHSLERGSGRHLLKGQVEPFWLQCSLGHGCFEAVKCHSTQHSAAVEPSMVWENVFICRTVRTGFRTNQRELASVWLPQNLHSSLHRLFPKLLKLWNVARLRRKSRSWGVARETSSCTWTRLSEFSYFLNLPLFIPELQELSLTFSLVLWYLSHSTPKQEPCLALDYLCGYLAPYTLPPYTIRINSCHFLPQSNPPWCRVLISLVTNWPFCTTILVFMLKQPCICLLYS